MQAWPDDRNGPDWINVLATREEWAAIINMLSRLPKNYEDHKVTEDIIHALLYAGVYE